MSAWLWRTSPPRGAVGSGRTFVPRRRLVSVPRSSKPVCGPQALVETGPDTAAGSGRFRAGAGAPRRPRRWNWLQRSCGRRVARQPVPRRPLPVDDGGPRQPQSKKQTNQDPPRSAAQRAAAAKEGLRRGYQRRVFSRPRPAPRLESLLGSRPQSGDRSGQARAAWAEGVYGACALSAAAALSWRSSCIRRSDWRTSLR